MRSTDNLALLLHIRDAVEKLEATRNAGQAAFINSPDAEDATKQRLTAIATSVPRLTEDMKKRYPGVDWRAFGGLIYEVYQGYAKVRPELFWNFLTGELPGLKEAIEEELQSLQAGGGGTGPDGH